MASEVEILGSPEDSATHNLGGSSPIKRTNSTNSTDTSTSNHTTDSAASSAQTTTTSPPATSHSPLFEAQGATPTRATLNNNRPTNHGTHPARAPTHRHKSAAGGMSRSTSDYGFPSIGTEAGQRGGLGSGGGGGSGAGGSGSGRGGSPPSPRHQRPTKPRRQSTQIHFHNANHGPPSSSSKHHHSIIGTDPAGGMDAKIVLLGAQGVGKTTMLHRYIEGQWMTPPSTIGSSFLAKKLVVDGHKVNLQIWDTAGQERFRGMARLYYRTALFAVLVYDITNKDSFNDVKNWIDEVRTNSPETSIVIVGAKADLADHHRKVDLEEAQATVAQWEWDYTHPPPPDKHEVPLQRQISPVYPSRPPSTRTSTASTTAPPSFSRTSTDQSIASRGRVAGSHQRPLISASTSMYSTSLSATAADDAVASQAVGLTRSPSHFSGLLGKSWRGRSLEDEERAREAGERALAERRMRECTITVSEVSARTDEGIEDLFLTIARRLIENREEIQEGKALRSQKSIILHAEPVPVPQSASMCC